MLPLKAVNALKLLNTLMCIVLYNHSIYCNFLCLSTSFAENVIEESAGEVTAFTEAVLNRCVMEQNLRGSLSLHYYTVKTACLVR